MNKILKVLAELIGASVTQLQQISFPFNHNFATPRLN